MSAKDVYDLYGRWRLMMDRCYNPKNRQYKDYGGRGIEVCSLWRDNPDYFVSWSRQTGYRPGLSLDRIDNDGRYDEVNCRWSTRLEQVNNRRNTIRVTAWGETMLVPEWVNDNRCGVTAPVIYYRLRTGWPPEKAIGTPARGKAS